MELPTIVQEHQLKLTVTMDWPRDQTLHLRDYFCPTCHVYFRHFFNNETWNHALKRAGLKAQDHPRPKEQAHG